MNQQWKEVAEFIGIAAIVASLVFVGIQLKQDREVALSEVTQFSASTYADLQIALADHSDALAKANRGEELAGPELIVVQSLLNAMHRQVVTDVIERRLHGNPGELPLAVFASWLYQNPGARAIWLDQRSEVLRHAEEISAESAFMRRVNQEILDALNAIDNSES